MPEARSFRFDDKQARNRASNEAPAPGAPPLDLTASDGTGLVLAELSARAVILKKQIIELSTRHRVLSPYTALLVLETEADYARFQIDRRALADVLTVGAGGLEVLHRSAASMPPPATPPPLAASHGKARPKAKKEDRRGDDERVEQLLALDDRGDSDEDGEPGAPLEERSQVMLEAPMVALEMAEVAEVANMPAMASAPAGAAAMDFEMEPESAPAPAAPVAEARRSRSMPEPAS